jgi:hypothetical protein
MIYSALGKVGEISGIKFAFASDIVSYIRTNWPVLAVLSSSIRCLANKYKVGLN